MRERLAPGMIVGGRFQVESVIGRGDIGEVYRVKDPKTGLSYALKLFTSPAMQDSAASGAFDRASRQSGQIASEFIALQELGMDPNGPFALYPALSTRALDRHIEKHGPLNLTQLTELMLCIGAPLQQAHNSGLIHGDLKPQNVFFGSGLKGPVVRVTDFGVVALRIAAPAPWPCAYGWGAPEQVGGSPLMAAMDIYALGLIAFYALVGRPIFTALKLPEPEPPRLWEEMHTLPAASDRGAELGGVVPRAFDDVLRRALAPDPNMRHGSVTEFVQDIERAAQVAQTQIPVAQAAHHGGPVAPPSIVSGTGQGPMHGTQVLSEDAVAAARAEIDALVAAKRAEAAASGAAPAYGPPPVVTAPAAAPPAVIGAPAIVGAIAPPPVVAGGGFSGSVASPPMVGAVAPPPVVGAPPVVGGFAPPPMVPDGSHSLDLAQTGLDGTENKRKVYGTMVADASEAFAMLESMTAAQAAAPPLAHRPAAPMPVPEGKSSPFNGGPIQPALVTGGGAPNLGATTAGGGAAQQEPARPAPSSLGQSHLGMAIPEQRRDATIMYAPPSGTNTKLIVLVVAVLVLIFGVGAALIAWSLSMDDPAAPPESSLPQGIEKFQPDRAQRGSRHG